MHLAYRIEESGLLSRRPIPSALRGGLMGLSDPCRVPLPQRERLLRMILRECAERKFAGVFVEAREASGERLVFYDELGNALRAQGKALYLPDTLPAPSAVLLVGTAVSGGSLREMLREKKARYGDRLALDLERLCMDFPLPCPTGTGTRLTPQQVQKMRERHGTSVFFSRELCAHYFTYAERGETHFVLFDDAETLQSKMALGRSLGIGTGFLLCAEVKDLLPALGEIAK